ncbi:unnamed protein product [Boreogadus saida]
MFSVRCLFSQLRDMEAENCRSGTGTSAAPGPVPPRDQCCPGTSAVPGLGPVPPRDQCCPGTGTSSSSSSTHYRRLKGSADCQSNASAN